VSPSRAALLSVGLYLLWVAATYVFEGRVHLLQRPDPVGRAIFTVVTNILVGILLAALVLRTFIRSGLVARDQLGFRSPRRTLIAVVLASLLGSGLFIVQGPHSREPLVLLNVFAQVLPTSIAEIVVCWVVIGAMAEALTGTRGKVVSLVVGMVAASALFGVYHFAHSPPFNEVGVVVFLMLIGIGTSLVYFFGRDVYATIIFHNFQGMFGILGSADLDVFRQPLYPLYVLALLGVAALIAVHALIVRPAARHQKAAPSAVD
jgi:hypothetical protein